MDTDAKFEPIFAAAAGLAGNPKTKTTEIIRAMQILGVAELERSLPPLSKWLSHRGEGSIQSLAIKTLARYAETRVTEEILTHWQDYTSEAQETALEVLMARADRTVALLKAIQNKAVAANALSPSQIQSLIQNKDKNISALAHSVLAAVLPQSRVEVTAKYSQAIPLNGDPIKGGFQFDQRCALCHLAGNRGHSVGPNLTTVKTKGREALLTAILEPNKEIAGQYIAYTVTTKRGDVFNGIVSEDKASSTTLTMPGLGTQKIDRSEIKGISSSGRSLMPEGLEGGMSVQDMADLLSFIEHLE